MQKGEEEAQNVRLLHKHKVGQKLTVCRLLDGRDKVLHRCRLLGIDGVHK